MRTVSLEFGPPAQATIRLGELARPRAELIDVVALPQDSDMYHDGLPSFRRAFVTPVSYHRPDVPPGRSRAARREFDATTALPCAAPGPNADRRNSRVCQHGSKRRG